MKHAMRTFAVLSASVIISLTHECRAQVVNPAFIDTAGGEHVGRLAIAGYVDAYYAYNFNRPPSGNSPYLVSSNRHDEATINLAFIDLRYNAPRVRARFVPAVGTYMNANYAAEPGTLQNILEASAGIRLFPNRQVWFDFGILGSPFTNENPVSKDHLMYTRSLSAEFSPYYLSGARISSPLGKKWTAALYLVNGWQEISQKNPAKAVATQVEFRPNAKHLLNWNTYFGNERSPAHPYSTGMRYFSDIYWVFNPSGRFSATSSLYGGVQEYSSTSLALPESGWIKWWQANLIGRVRFTRTLSVSGRLEYFSDPDFVFVKSISGNAFRMFGTGLCLNAELFENAMLRLEGRHFLNHSDPVSQTYLNYDTPLPFVNTTLLAASLAVWF